MKIITRWVTVDRIIPVIRSGRPVEYMIRHEFKEIVVRTERS